MHTIERSAPTPRQAHVPPAFPSARGTATELARRTALRAGLGRRPREIADWYLVGPDESRLAGLVRRMPGCGYGRAERELLSGVLPTMLETTRPHTIVHLHPDAGDASDLVFAELRRRALAAGYVGVGTDVAAVREAVERADRAGVPRVHGTIADPASELPDDRTSGAPRLVLCLANALGRYSRVGAVRMLRIVRAAMAPGDALLLGVDLRNDVHALELAFNDTTGVIANYHKRVLAAASRALGANFDPDRFDFRAVYDVDSRRLEMRLVARDTHDVHMPGLEPFTLRRGESIRTASSMTFSRGSIAAMLTGVGLDLRWWAPDASESYAIAIGTPAV